MAIFVKIPTSSMAVSSSVFEYLKGMRWRAISEKYSLASLAVEVPKPAEPTNQSSTAYITRMLEFFTVWPNSCIKCHIQLTTCTAAAKWLDGGRCGSIASRCWRQLSIDICPHQSSAANPLHFAAAVDWWDRQTDGYFYDAYHILCKPCKSSLK